MKPFEKRALTRAVAPFAREAWARYRDLRARKEIPEAPDGLPSSALLAYLVEKGLASDSLASRLEDLRLAEEFEATRPTISVVIASLNTKTHLEKCLRSIVRFASVPTEILVVDGGSKDGSLAAVSAARADYHAIEPVDFRESISFAMSSNEGARRASGRTLVFLNSDTIVTARWDEALLDALARENVAAAGPTSNAVKGAQINPRASIGYADEDGLRDFAWDETHRYWGRVTETNFLSGFCLATRADTWDEIGEFDERFVPGNFEDDDWCLRAQVRGYRLLVARAAYVHHVGQKTFEANAIGYAGALTDNHRRMNEKWGPELLGVPGA